MRAISLRAIATGLALITSPAFEASASTSPVSAVGAASAPYRMLLPAMDLDGIANAAPDPECEQDGPRRAVRSRNPGPLSWLFHRDREKDEGGEERRVRSFAFYLRSPLLSGLFGCPPSPGATAGEPAEECAELTITTTALEEHRIEVPLPQLRTRSARRLRGRIEEQLEHGRAVTVTMTDGEPFSIIPGAVHEVQARECRRRVSNEL